MSVSYCDILHVALIHLCILGKLDSINKPIIEVLEELSTFLSRDRNGHSRFGMGFGIEARMIAVICIKGGCFNGVLFVLGYLVDNAFQWAHPITKDPLHPLRFDYPMFKN